MLAYAKNSLWDFVLCVAASTALAFTLCSGFYATQPFQDVAGTAIVAGLCALITLLLFAVSRTSKTALIGGPLLALALIGAVVASVVPSAGESALDDVPGNYLYFSLVVILPTVFVYVLSRWRGASLVMLVLGTFACALIEYLYWYGHYGAMIVFLVAAAGLFAYRTYQVSLMNSASEHLAFGSVTLFGAALAFAAVAIGVGVFAFAIAPFNPPNLVLKLYTQEFRAQEIEVKGVAASEDAPAENQYSMNMSNEIIYSSDVNDALYNDLGEGQVGRGNATTVQVRNSTLNLGSMDEGEGSDDALSLDWPNWLWLIVLCSILALVLLAILVKKLHRHRRYRQFLAQGNDGAVEGLYRFFLDRFERFKMPALGSMTLAEYATNNAGTLEKFASNAATPAFSELTDVYVSHVFGGSPVDDTQMSIFKRYYKVFYKNAVRYVGWLKYPLLFFRV
ncbi:MAG: hypothetical protein IJ087_08365 [Eggerthellaceae bacterium]|nr:hypothetical protein [Eggerthellaceae bacterium]